MALHPRPARSAAPHGTCVRSRHCRHRVCFAQRLRRVGRRNLEMAFPTLPPPNARRSCARVSPPGLAAGRVLPRCLPNTQEYAKPLHPLPGTRPLRRRARPAARRIRLTGHLARGSCRASTTRWPATRWGCHPPADNALVDRLVNRIRCQHGNRVLHKDDFRAGLIWGDARGRDGGILMDTT